MRSRQRGATALGMLCIVAVIGFGLYGVIRVFPLYMEYMAIARALEQTAKESAGNNPTRTPVAVGGFAPNNQSGCSAQTNSRRASQEWEA